MVDASNPRRVPFSAQVPEHSRRWRCRSTSAGAEPISNEPGQVSPLSNQALKLTRLSACQLGGRASAHNHAVQWSCTQSAVQLNAGVRRPLKGKC
jgi:hypothetical protein